jgi:hypothetical protein
VVSIPSVTSPMPPPPPPAGWLCGGDGEPQMKRISAIRGSPWSSEHRSRHHHHHHHHRSSHTPHSHIPPSLRTLQSTTSHRHHTLTPHRHWSRQVVPPKEPNRTPFPNFDTTHGPIPTNVDHGLHDKGEALVYSSHTSPS